MTQEVLRCPAQSAGHMANIGACLADMLVPGDVVLMRGTLGMGKTTFVRGAIQALCGPTQDVPSPSFPLVQTYEGRKRQALYHFDLYRLNVLEEIWELGFEEAFESGISFVEWPELAHPLLPLEHLNVEIHIAQEQNYCVGEDCAIRQIHFTAPPTSKWVQERWPQLKTILQVSKTTTPSIP